MAIDDLLMALARQKLLEIMEKHGIVQRAPPRDWENPGWTEDESWVGIFQYTDAVLNKGFVLVPHARHRSVPYFTIRCDCVQCYTHKAVVRMMGDYGKWAFATTEEWP